MVKAMRMVWLSCLVVVTLTTGCGDERGAVGDDAGVGTDGGGHDGGAIPDGATTDGDTLGDPVVCDELGVEASPAVAIDADFYVSQWGSDDNDGRSPATAFASVQAGVDALSAGDTLVIGPGEYTESVAREGLGSAGQTTTIRAAIPGTVTLRGDVPAPQFQKLDGTHFTYVADLDGEHVVQVINELDTLQVIEKSPSLAELESSPGAFYQDHDAGKLYLSTSDRRPADSRTYTLSVIPTHGIYLTDPVEVVIDGINVTGFNTATQIHHRQRTAKTVWGIFLFNGKDCVIRRAHAYLNARGIGTYSAAEYAADNRIEHCVARANMSRVGESQSDTGGITLFEPQRDVVAHSESFLNRDHGINIRGGGETGREQAYQSFMRDSLAWGNGAPDFKIKTGYDHIHYAQRSVGLSTLDNTSNAEHCLFGEKPRDFGDDTIVMSQEDDLDPHAEFADPDNFDFRLQSTSRFRGAMDDGSDRGPYAYEETVFYVGADGDDAADGLSVASAWATLERATRDLGPGDTLYVLPGVHAGDVDVQLAGTKDAPISIRGRGLEPAVLSGQIRLIDSEYVNVQRLRLEQSVQVIDTASVRFENTTFTSPHIGLDARQTDGLQAFHNTFVGFEGAAISLEGTTGVDLRGNLYDNHNAPAVRTDDAKAVIFSDYHSYRDMARAWQVGETLCTLDAPAQWVDAHSRQAEADFDMSDGDVELRNPEAFAAAGPLARPVGTFRDEFRKPTLELVGEPSVHSVSATTANIEWSTSVPATTHFSWGPTEEVENQVSFEVLYAGNYSFTGLAPDTTYYFRIDSLSIPDIVGLDLDPVQVDGPLLSFTTAPSDPAPQTYYVAEDGDDTNVGTSPEQAWRTIQHAADQVAVGDTVEIGQGTYQERVRIRATGAPGAPITFRSAPGEKVVLDGDMKLNQAFAVAAKTDLVFDGFYFDNYHSAGTFPAAPDARWDSWRGGQSGLFNIYRSRDITISRTLSDGRGSTQARDLTAHDVENLHVDNMVSTNKFGGALYLLRVPGFLLEHSVIARQQISAFLLRNEPNEQAVMRNNIFTDNLKKKADLNIAIFTADRSTEGLLHENNVYFLRGSPPVAQRHLFYATTTLSDAQASGLIVNPLVTDPKFAGAEALVATGEERPPFSPDRLVGALDVEYDFTTFMATDQEVLDRDIGLQPDKFENGLVR